MKYFVLSFFFIGLLCSYELQAQIPKQIWAICGLDSASGLVLNDMASDTSGNTYYTGYTTDSSYYANHHFLLVKINENGGFEWIKNYPFATKDTFETGNTLAVDKKGFIYVAGELQDSFCNICTQSVKVRDQFVIKYSPSGNVVWMNRFNGTRYTNQSPAKIAVTDNGNVYVTGTESVYNAATFEYNSKGYLHRLGPQGNSSFIKRIKELQPSAITIDNNNDIIFGGRLLSQNLYQLAKIFIAKYSFRGDSIWSSTFSEANKNGGAQYIKTDVANNIYVLGQTDTITFYNNPRAILLKYNSGGTLLWRYKEPDRTYCRYSTSGLQLDSRENIYTACYIDNQFTTNEDWYISKFNTHGVKKWSHVYNDSLSGNNYPTGIAVDEKSNVFIAGLSGKKFNPYMYGTMQLDSSGNRKWFKQYSSLPRGNNFSIGIALTGKSVITGGYTTKGVCAVKYDYSNIVSPRNAFVNNKELENSHLLVYPNPATNFIQLKIPSSISCRSISIVNSYGVTVKQIANLQGNNLISITINTLSSGIYFIQLNRNDGMKYVSSFTKK